MNYYIFKANKMIRYPLLNACVYGDRFGRAKQDLNGGKNELGIRLSRHCLFSS